MLRPLVLALLLAAGPSAAADSRADALALALAAAGAGDWDAAQKVARAAGPTASDYVAWARLRAGRGAFADYAAFLARHPDWPGLALLQRRGEARALADMPPSRDVIAYFGKRPPATGAGVRALAAAYAAARKPDLARATVTQAWTTLALDPGDLGALLVDYGPVLKPLHALRLEAMLWRGDDDGARAMLPLVGEGEQRLAAARLGLRAGAPGVDALIAAVPKALAGDPGLAYERFRWRIGRGRTSDAEDLMLAQGETRAGLGDPAAWAASRAALARREMREGDPHRAYRLAASHGLTGGSAYADLEWLAGYVALEKLGQPKTALKHFRAFRAAVSTAISLGRAGYWEGRAREAAGDAEGARAAYAYGAEFQSGFYGLLAAERIGLPMDPRLVGTDRYPDWTAAKFLSSSVLDAGLLLLAAGDGDAAKRFFLHLAETQDRIGLGQLADLALAKGAPHIALMIAKQAAERGILLPRAYYPIVDFSALKLPVPPELALAIARRESQFDAAVVSGAGARGLMQLMPGTATLMAPKLGLAYDRSRLTGDASYNARLGSAYLAQLRDEFGPAVTLVAAGYNAGPGRPRTWIVAFGDPRAEGVDPVDWIESVPFTETRDYIMRVAESVTIYRARLAGHPVPLRLTEELKGR